MDYLEDKLKEGPIVLSNGSIQCERFYQPELGDKYIFPDGHKTYGVHVSYQVRSCPN